MELLRLIMRDCCWRSGRILVDGVPVEEAGRSAFRRLFAAVFTDFYLFEQLLDEWAADQDPQFRRLFYRELQRRAGPAPARKERMATAFNAG